MPKKVEIVLRTFVIIEVHNDQSDRNTELMVQDLESYISTQIELDYGADLVETEIEDVEVYNA